MKNKFRYAVLFSAIALMLCLAAGCGGGSSSGGDAKKDDGKMKIPEFLKVSSSSAGGAWYPINVSHNGHIEALVKKMAPEAKLSIGLNPGGSTANVKSVAGGQADIGICHTAIATMGYNGSAPFDKPMKNVRHLLSINPAAVFIAVRADSNIHSIDDLKDKRIGFYPQGSLGNTIVEQLFEVSGFTIEDIKKNGGSISYLGFAEGPGQLADNQVDCYTVLGSWPVTTLMEIDFNPGIRVIPVDDALFAKLNAKYPLYTQFEIPAGTFKSFNEPFKTVGSMVCLIATDKMSDDMAYIATKAFWDNLQDIKERAVDARGADLKTAMSGMGIPLHPGAAKYYKEKGMEVK